MPTLRSLALLLFVIAALALAACGGDDEVEDVKPSSTPELTVPSGDEAADADEDAETTTTTTSTTDTTEGTTPAPAPAPTPTPPPAPAPQGTGGAQAPATGDQGGGTGRAEDNFQDFCEQNPGAC